MICERCDEIWGEKMLQTLKKLKICGFLYIGGKLLTLSLLFFIPESIFHESAHRLAYVENLIQHLFFFFESDFGLIFMLGAMALICSMCLPYRRVGMMHYYEPL